MLDRVVHHDALLHLIRDLQHDWRLIGPVAHAVPDASPPVRYRYEPVDDIAELALDFSYAVYSPRRWLMPPREPLFRFSQASGTFAATPRFDDQLTALVGVHPCDLHAIGLLDHVFNTGVPDEHYRARRERLLIVGVDCAAPCTEGCFCNDLGTNAAERGFDVMLYPLDAFAEVPPPPAERVWGVVLGSEVGRTWLAHGPNSSATKLPTPRDARLFEVYKQRKAAAFPYRLTTAAEDLPALLHRSYDSLLWEATGKRCYSCGSCNLVCPTCYCFDIEDTTDLPPTSGVRERRWDGCQLTDFALVAGDHNFRAKAAQRLRHRIFRKGAWVRERTGLTGCVGCGRCDRACSAHIRSVEIYNQLAEED